MKILRTTDRVKLKMDNGLSVTISPLTLAQKTEIASKTTMKNGAEVPDAQAQALLCVKYAVKALSGFEDYEGNEFTLDFDGENLTEACTDDVLAALAEAELMLPVIQASNKGLSQIKGIEVEVNPKS